MPLSCSFVKSTSLSYGNEVGGSLVYFEHSCRSHCSCIFRFSASIDARTQILK